MKLLEAFKIIEENAAPVALSNELCSKYGHYDNSGIMLENEGDISGALFSLDFTPEAVDMAVKNGCNLIVTHHPAIYHGQRSITPSNDLVSRALVGCIKHDIGVISMHLNFDSAPKGIDYYLMKGLGGEEAEALLNPLSSGGYGRIYAVPAQSFGQFSQKAAAEFESGHIRFYGGRQVKKAASFCGAGCDDEAIAFAISRGADTFVSADMKHHQITALISAGLNVVEMTHYCSEVYGFARIYASINGSLGVPSAFFKEEMLL